jgi:hypothetical protein
MSRFLNQDRWQVGDDFAVKVEASDLSGFLRKTLVVEPGTSVVILEHGVVNLGPLGPGKHDLRQFNLSGLSESTAVLMRDAVTELSFDIDGLFTTDPVEIGLTCRLTVEIDEPLAFVRNVMVDRSNLSLDELEMILEPEVRSACASFLRTRTIQELDNDLRNRDGLGAAIGSHLESIFSDFGLRFENIRSLDLRHDSWDDIRREKSRYFVGISQEEALRDDRRRLADLLNEKSLDELAEAGRRVEVRRRRLEVWQGISDALIQERHADLRHQQAVQDLVREHDKYQVIADAEVVQLSRDIEQQGLDAETARAHLVAKAERERRHELDLIERSHRRSLSETDLDFEAWVENEKQKHLMHQERQRWELELERRKRERDFINETRLIDRENEDEDVKRGLDYLNMIRKRVIARS